MPCRYFAQTFCGCFSLLCAKKCSFPNNLSSSFMRIRAAPLRVAWTFSMECPKFWQAFTIFPSVDLIFSFSRNPFSPVTLHRKKKYWYNILALHTLHFQLTLTCIYFSQTLQIWTTLRWMLRRARTWPFRARGSMSTRWWTPWCGKQPQRPLPSLLTGYPYCTVLG